jgi:hypothetical protein
MERKHFKHAENNGFENMKLLRKNLVHDQKINFNFAL